MIQFTAYGVPAPKGSTKAFMRPGMKYPVVTADCKRTKPWAETVKGAAIDAVNGNHIPFPDEAVRIEILFKLPRPKTLPRRVVDHLKKPDVDKLTRAVFDALKGVVWSDDSQVVSQRSDKVYVRGSEMPCAIVRIDKAATLQESIEIEQLGLRAMGMGA